MAHDLFCPNYLEINMAGFIREPYKNRMMLFALIPLLAIPQGTASYKILIAPYISGFNSRLLNMQKMADILAQDGHEITVLMNTKVKDHWIAKSSKMLEFQTSESHGDVGGIENKPTSSLEMVAFLYELLELERSFLRSMISDKKVMQAIHDEQFDLLIADINSVPSVFLASHLNITTIWYQNYFMPTDPNVFYPILPSIVCTMPGAVCRGHYMDFKDRLINFAMYFLFTNFLQDLFLSQLLPVVDAENFVLKVPVNEVTKNKVIIINTNYVLDTPVPKMPHVFPISGLFHKKPSPLTKDFTDLIEASQPHGVILVSFGTLKSEFDDEKADMFARVLGRLPHTVIWRNTGQPPESLKPNTHLVGWFPQNDLLANPAVQLFITHCGISSTFESTFHSVPVLAMPLNGDQDDNAEKLTSRVKMGIKLNFDALTEEIFERNMQEVLSNPMYRENAKKASVLMNDHLVSPQQQLHHLVNFTIKSGGAHHLFHPYAVDMHWFQFYSLDVIFFLLTVVSLLLMCFFLITRFILRCTCKMVFGQGKEKTS